MELFGITYCSHNLKQLGRASKKRTILGELQEENRLLQIERSYKNTR